MNKYTRIRIDSKNTSYYFYFGLIVLRFLLPAFITERMGGSILFPLMILSLLLMAFYIVNHRILLDSFIGLIICGYVIQIFSTILNHGEIFKSILYSVYIITECLFLNTLMESGNDEIYVYLKVIRDISLVIALANLITGILMPQGVSPVVGVYATRRFIYGNINGTARNMMPGLCCSCVLDAKNEKRISIYTILFLVSFFYFCINIRIMATGLVGMVVLIIWILIQRIGLKHYKVQYAVIIAFVLLFEFTVVLLFGNSRLIALTSNIFSMKTGFSGREALWLNIIRKIKESPIIGYGLLNSDNMKYLIGNSYGSHNYYLDVVFERGFLGLLPLLYIALTPVIKNLQREISTQQYILIGVCASYLVMFLMEPFIDAEYLHIPIFYITMSLIANNHKSRFILLKMNRQSTK